jgi:hypothetical protein
VVTRADKFDPYCADLAEMFLQHEPYHGEPGVVIQIHEQRVRDLAAAIHRAVEDWIDDHPLDNDLPAR